MIIAPDTLSALGSYEAGTGYFSPVHPHSWPQDHSGICTSKVRVADALSTGCLSAVRFHFK